MILLKYLKNIARYRSKNNLSYRNNYVEYSSTSCKKFWHFSN